MTFLPDNYQVPSSSDRYMKFQPGENKFRILSKPIMGSEWWVTGEDGKRSPKRVRAGEKISPDQLEDDIPKHFWAMVVFDYKDEKIKILEITQKGIQKSLTNLSYDEDWGDPVGEKGYDISVTREGDGKDTRYGVNPKPRKELKEGVMQLYKDMGIDLEALFSGDDPFAPKPKDEKVNPDDIPF